MCQDVRQEVKGVRGCSGPSPSRSHADQRLTALVPSQDSDIEETGHALRSLARPFILPGPKTKKDLGQQEKIHTM